MPPAFRQLAFAVCLTFYTLNSDGDVWIEGESALRSTFPAGAPFAPQNAAQQALLSGGGWLNAAGVAGDTPPSAAYRVTLDAPGTYRLWVRKFWQHGPFRWLMKRQDHAGAWQRVTADAALIERTPIRPQVEASWVLAGAAELGAGPHTLEVELLAAPGEDFVAGIDCFWLTSTHAVPRGATPPGAGPPPAHEPGWFVFDPVATDARPELNLRALNETVAGQHGPLRREGATITLADGTPTRFWGVNAPPNVSALPDPLQKDLARDLARIGVNLVRLHGALADTRDPALPVDPARLAHAHRLVAHLKAQGIYSHLSWYFPLWLQEGGADPAPFGKLFYDEPTQARYLDLMRSALGAVNPHTGRSLARDPAVGFIELCNEDSLFFWTFKPAGLPPTARQALESRFEGELLSPWQLTGDGLATLSKASRSRAAKQARFYAQLQHDFYARAAAVLRDELGFEGLIVAGNWHTADPARTDVFERWSYTAGDVIDHHGYFEPAHTGEAAAHRVAPGQSFADRPAIRNPAASPLRPVGVAGHPQMVSEFGWPQPNRFRGDAAVLTAALASLQDVDALAWFCLAPGLLDAGITKFGLGTPVMAGGFPAAALMFRRGDLAPAPATLTRHPGGPPATLLGSGPAGAAALDHLRGGHHNADSPTKPRALHAGPHAGPACYAFGTSPAAPRVPVPPPTQDATWDTDAGLLRVVTARSVAAAGFLAQAGTIQLGPLTVQARVHHGSIVAVALDHAPLTRARRILVQALTEDRPTGWRSRARIIESLGTPPWRVRDIQAILTLPWTGPPPRRVTALDGRGVAQPSDAAWSVQNGRLRLTLPHDRLYTLIER